MKDNPNNQIFEKAPLKDRMTVYVGVFVVLLVSWFYILGMGWHMNTIPFVENKMIDMSMDMEKPISFLDTILMWMPPSSGSWVLSDFILLFLMWSVMMIAMMTPSILPMLMLFVLFFNKGKVIEQKVGAVSKEELTSVLDKLIEG